MAKISDLDLVANPDGNETVVVLKDGRAKRASVGDVVAPRIAGLKAMSDTLNPQNIQQRDALPLAARRNGFMCFVQDLGKVFRLSKDNTNPDDPGVFSVVAIDNFGESDTAKIMTADERQQIAALAGRVFAPKFTAFALSRNPVEYGDTGSISLTWSVSDAPASQKLNGNAIGNGDRSAVLAAPGGGWTADTVNETVALFNGAGAQTDARTLAITARVPIFVGIAASATPDNTALIGAAYKALDSDRIARSLTLARAGGGFPFVLYPAARQLATIKLGGFAVSGWAPSDKAVTLVTGATVGMKLVILDAVAASATPLAVELS